MSGGYEALKESFEPLQDRAVVAPPDLDTRAWLRVLREIPTGDVTEADFKAWLEGPLRRFFPFERFFSAYGRLSGRHMQATTLAASGHAPEFLASRATAFAIKARSCVEWWMGHRRSMLLDKTTATNAAAARITMSEPEIDDIRRFSLGGVAQHGVFDPFAASGVHLGFSGVPTNRPAHTLAALELVTPVVCALYFRTRQIARVAAALPSLTDRQRDLVELAALGLSDKAIAARLGISENTVGNHFRAIYAKLGISKRSQLVALAK